jgi:putative endonuclease
MNNIETGIKGEKLAKEFLVKNGYKIIETNKRFSRFCEIDIIALDKDTLVFIEVKTRKTNFCGSPFEAITKTKYQNIKKGVFYYLQEKPSYKKFRIDAISIVLQPKVEIKHLKNI